MNKETIYLTLIVTMVLLIGGCESMSSKQATGAVIGGITGGALGSRIGGGKGRVVTTLLGIVIGAWAGVTLVDYLEHSDEKQIIGGLENTPSDKPGEAQWTNTDTKIDYTSTVSPAWNTTGTWCRKFQTSAIIDGKKETLEGSACRQEDGMWRADK